MIRDLALTALERLEALLLSPGSLLSLWSLVAALLIAAAVALAKRQGRAVSLRAMGRAMFPRHRIFSASARADFAFTLLSVFASATLFGWAVMSHVGIAGAVARAFGHRVNAGTGALQYSHFAGPRQ